MRRLGLLIALAALIVGCGGDDENPTTTVNQTTTVTETSPPATTPPPAETTPTETTPGDGTGCTAADGNEIQLVSGVTCAQAKTTAAQYDAQGARVQEIGDWVCEGGNAQTRPVLFTCSTGSAEFVVRATSGLGGP